MPRNPSELARIEDELSFYVNSLLNGIHSKKTKDYLIENIRKREAQLGLAGEDYNSPNFRKHYERYI
jgi:membrane-anchored protein YejM (alkaline phosphatase superfamily)